MGPIEDDLADMNSHLTLTRTRILLTCGVAAALTVAALTTLAKATTPGQNGLIAFTRYRLQNAPIWSEIFVAQADGSGLKKVSHSPTAVEDDQAHWSPDGTWIVFDRCTSNGPCSLWLVRPDGSGQRRLSPPCSTQRPPPVCPDDGGPSFAPDGRHVVFTHEWGHVKRTSLGDQIEHSAIAAVDLDGKHLTILRQLPPYAGDLQAPRISPDGKLIVFDRYNSASARPAGADALFLTAASGGIARQLTPWRLSAGSPDWSPDGKQVLFKRFIAGAGELTPGTNLYTIGVDGTGLRRVTNVGADHYVLAGSFSPDGTSIVFATDAEATANPNAAQPFADVFTMRFDGANLKRATRTPNLDGWPTWGPSATG
jgi:Tol biopolymer transport system component